MGPKKKLKKDFQKIFEEEHVDIEKLQENIDEQKKNLVTYLQESFHPPIAGSPLDQLILTCDYFLPHYSKADLLAIKYQKLYRRASKAIYALAACAVMIVSAQYIFELPVYIIHGEIASMLIILLVIGYGSKRIGWHRRWLDYRLLAERLRFGIFTAFLAIAFPVSGAGFSALRGQFELKKVATSSAMMTKCLASFQERLNEIKDLMDLRELVIEAETLMLQENADWHVTMRFHELEPPA